MSDNIPFEIQIDIIKKLPIKSLIQFRSVSKAWKSFIDSYDFIAHYSCQQEQHLLIKWYQKSDVLVQNYVSIVEDHTFPQQKVSLTPPPLVDMLKISSLIGTSHGLLFSYGYHCDERGIRLTYALLWNVTIRKAIGVVLPNVVDERFRNVIGFGVCSETNDPKIVKISQISHWSDVESISCIPRQVEVFTLSTRVWRSSNGNLPRKSIDFSGFYVMVEETLYWIAEDRTMDCNMIISFDLMSEEFKEVNLPDTLADDQSVQNLSLFNLRESLVVIEIDGGSYIVWKMEDDISKSFTQLYSIRTPDALIVGVRGFMKSGEPIVLIAKDYYTKQDSWLAVYEPHLKRIKNIGMEGTDVSFSVFSYMETLLLLDQPNSIIYGKD